MASPALPLTRDMRSSDVPFKRDRDAAKKWAHGYRPSAGVKLESWSGNLLGGSDSQRVKFRPERQESHRAPRHFSYGPRDRHDETNDFDPSSPTSRSLLDLLPTHNNNHSPRGIANVALASPDAGVFYSFERKEAPGGPVDLGDLIERAERRWEGQRTEKLVRGEWEVLNDQGESVRLSKGKGRIEGRGREKPAGEGEREGERGRETTVEDGFELL